jgi:15-cis-phytoene synthase
MANEPHAMWQIPGLRGLGEAAAYCRKLTTKSQSNFYYAFLFLPPARRAALEAVYAYCRLVDDVVDEDAPVAQKLAGLERWRHELDAVYAGAESSHPVTAGLREAISHFPIRREDMEAIIDGCAMDVERDRYGTWDELRTYCYRVASAVGLMCIEIFGYSSPEARRYAVDLGIALQLTNIIRDVAEDAQRGRIYLPKEDLDRFGVSEEELSSTRGLPSANVVRLLRFEANRARNHYVRARAAIGADERRKLVIAEIMGDIYYALLLEIEARGFDVFRGKAVVPRRHKMAIAVRNFAGAKLHSLRASVA